MYTVYGRPVNSTYTALRSYSIQWHNLPTLCSQQYTFKSYRPLQHFKTTACPVS